MKPEEQRAHLGNYGLAAFETPLMSVMAYMLNLNTHAAYGDLRNLRATARAQGKAPRGRDLAAGLSKYSERGEAYVTSLRNLMTANKLDATDDAYLATGPGHLPRAARRKEMSPTHSEEHMIRIRPCARRSLVAALALTASIPFASLVAQQAATGLDLAGMDLSVKPGDNFFYYANGTWIKNTPIPPDRSSYGAGSILVELTDRRVAD